MPGLVILIVTLCAVVMFYAMVMYCTSNIVDAINSISTVPPTEEGTHLSEHLGDISQHLDRLVDRHDRPTVFFSEQGFLANQVTGVRWIRVPGGDFDAEGYPVYDWSERDRKIAQGYFVARMAMDYDGSIELIMVKQEGQ